MHALPPVAQPVYRNAPAARLALPLVLGCTAGLVLSLLGLAPVLRIWPLLAIPFLFTPLGGTVTIATLGGVLTVTGISQLNSTPHVLYMPGELYYGEAIIYDQAARILHGQPLYLPHDRPPYSHTAYTPVYYGVVAGLRVILGPGFLPGRLVWFVSGLVTAWLVGYIVARRTGRREPGVLGGLFFLTLGLPWVESLGDPFHPGDAARTFWDGLWMPVAASAAPLAALKEDMFGIALSVASIAVLLGGTSRRRLAVAATLAAVAFLTKQTFVAAGLAGVIWLWLRNRDQAVFFGSLGMAIAVGVTVIFELTSHAYLENIMFANVNPIRFDVLALNLPTFLRFQTGPVIVAAAYSALAIRRGRFKELDGLLITFWLATILPAAGIARVGAAANHWYVFGASTAVLATLGLWQQASRYPSVGRTLLPAGRLGRGLGKVARLRLPDASAVIGITPVLLTLALMAMFAGGPNRIRPVWPTPPDPASQREFYALVDRVQAESREVLAATLDVVTLADRPLLLEPYIFSVLWHQGAWNPQPLVQRICARQVGLLLFFNPLEFGSGTYHGISYWPPPVLKALQETMVFDSVQAGRYLYIPKPLSDQPLTPAPGQVCLR